MAALSYLDDKNGTNKLQNHLNNWDTFIRDKPNWNLGRHIKTFNDSMDFLHEIREGGN